MNNNRRNTKIKTAYVHRRASKAVIAKRIFMIIIGAIFMAMGIELFLVPNHLLDGGIVGISIILSHLTGLQIGLFIFLLNIPFFFIGYKQIGKTFALIYSIRNYGSFYLYIFFTSCCTFYR